MGIIMYIIYLYISFEIDYENKVSGSAPEAPLRYFSR